MHIRYGLGFHALCRIDHEKSSLTGGERSGNFVRKIYMTRSVNQVEEVSFPIFGLIIQTDRMGFDGDSAFPFQVHRVKELSLHISFGDQTRSLKQTVG